MNTLAQASPIEFPALTVAQIAAALVKAPQVIRKQLRGTDATGKRTVGGNVADTWRLGNLPAPLLARLKKASGGNDLVSVAQMFTGGFKQWTPPVPLADIADESLTEADKLKRALVPSLRRQFVITQGGFERDGVKDYEKVFGRKITTRHFRELIRRTVQRAGGLENWERLELYLPAKPERKPAITEPPQQFPALASAINAGAAPDEIWKKTFQLHDELVRAGQPRNRVARQLRAFIGERAPALAPSPDALRKAFNRKLERHQAGETFDQRADNGADDSELTRQIKALGWFVPAARFFYLLTNRTADSGSLPEAIRRTISLPALPVGWKDRTRSQFLRALGRKANRKSGGDVPACAVELREKILSRQQAGQALVSAQILKLITVSRATVRQHRHPTNAGLDLLCAPGALFFIRDSQTGERRPPLTGEVIEADDATINFPVCVPWILGGDPCSDKYGVKVGRFQWLVAIDAARRFVTAYSYIMRPRSSYRGEDTLTLLRTHCLQHGKPGRFRLEQGVWKSDLVKHALKSSGIELETVTSPHRKPYIEGLFNTLWTKLSVHFPDAHVGRFRGENKEANDLLVACQRGSRDPRRYFPMLTDAIAAFDEVIREKNQTPVKSEIGRWIPAEAWAARTPGAKLDEQTSQLFAPWQRTWTVRGMIVGGKIPLFEDLSIPFDFSTPWLPQYDGAKVRCHFDPSAPRCTAMVVLAENFHGESAGKILGQAEQINDVAGYSRMVLGFGDDPSNAGLLARQRAATALRREVRAIVPKGGAHASSEERDGISQVTRIERDGAGNEIVADGKARSESRLMQLLDDESPEEKEEYSNGCERRRREEQRRFTENFERNHPELLV
jgi:hypothetical protein